MQQSLSATTLFAQNTTILLYHFHEVCLICIKTHFKADSSVFFPLLLLPSHSIRDDRLREDRTVECSRLKFIRSTMRWAPNAVFTVSCCKFGLWSKTDVRSSSRLCGRTSPPVGSLCQCTMRRRCSDLMPETGEMLCFITYYSSDNEKNCVFYFSISALRTEEGNLCEIKCPT